MADLRAMKQETNRLATFDEWSNPFVTPSELAKSGFFAIKDGDAVKCAFCQGILANWVLGDDPKTEHARNLPACPFVQDLPVGNIPNGVIFAPNSPGSRDLVANYKYEWRPNARPERAQM